MPLYLRKRCPPAVCRPMIQGHGVMHDSGQYAGRPKKVGESAGQISAGGCKVLPTAGATDRTSGVQSKKKAGTAATDTGQRPNVVKEIGTMNEYSTTSKTAEAAGPLADLEAVKRVRDGIVKAAMQHWHCHIMERSNLDQALRYDELNDQLRNMSAYVVACPVCGRPVRYDHLAQDAYGYDMCPSCLIEAGYVKCDHCGEYHNSENLETVHVWISERCYTVDEAWCEGCRDDDAYTCDSCGELYAGFGDCDGETAVYNRDGEENYRHLCPSCEEQLPHCYDCGNTLETDCYRDAYGDAYCCECKRESKYLQGYDHTYASNYYRTKDDPTPAGLYLGVELETEAYRTENPEALAMDVIMAVGDERVVCKEDGSLMDGCEIVTQPMSAAYHLAPLDDLGGRRLWDVILDTCAEHNARSHNGGNCGLHIHVSRTWLDTDDKVTTFIRLVQGHAAEWQVFSRRNLDNMSYCRLESDFQSGISLGDSPAEKRRKTYRKTGHHTAINCENYATVELRLWRGTLVKQTLRATIEATAALALIAGDYLTDIEALESWSWRDLVKQMVKALDRYKLPSADLLAYLQARNL